MKNPHNFTFLSGNQDLFNRTVAFYEKGDNYSLSSVQGIIESKMSDYIYDEDDGDLIYVNEELDRIVTNATDDDKVLLDNLLICVCGYSLGSLNISDLANEIHENITSDNDDAYDQSIRFMRNLMDEAITESQVQLANSFFSTLCETSLDEIMCDVFKSTQILMDDAKNRIAEENLNSSNSLQ